MIVCVVNFYRYGILTKTNITIPALVMIKILGSLRSFILSCVVLYSKVYPFEIKVEEQKKEISKVDDIKDIKVDENLQKFIQITGSKLTIPEKKDKTTREVENLVPLSPKEILKRREAALELKQINYICYFISLLNKLFLYESIRSLCGIIWALMNLVLALIIRPVIGNWILFGTNANSKKFEYLKPLRKTNKRNKRFNTLAK